MRALHWSIAAYPASWLCTVTVIRDGGKDVWGLDLPDLEFAVDRCLVGFRASSDAPDWEDQPDDRASLFIEPGRFTFLHNDRIDVPEGPWASGRWWIDGRPQTGPLGTECRLRRRI